MNAPTSVTYRRGAGIGYYIDGAGGYSARANKDGTFLQQPNGLIQKRKRPEPGAVIFVPTKDPARRGTTALDILTALAPLLSAATTIIVVLVR